jgi:phage-related protein
MPEKRLLWVGSSLQDLKAFPEDARCIAGHQLHLVQQGLEPHDWKNMGSVGLGVCELRIHTSVEHRVLYVAKFEEGVYVLHAFQKNTRKTAQRDLDLARRRYWELMRHRRESRRIQWRR